MQQRGWGFVEEVGCSVRGVGAQCKGHRRERKGQEEILSKKRKRGSRRHEVDPPLVGRGKSTTLGASTAPPPSGPQVGLRKSDSYLMTLSPASSSEQPVLTGGLKGTEAKAQVIDLWPQRSASGAEDVVLPQWEPQGTPQ